VELAQSYLADIGMTVSCLLPDLTTLGAVLVGGDYDLVVFGWSGSPLFTQAPFQYWNSASGQQLRQVLNNARG
jgi:peptide/nickel transport system substrate-binding protein